MDKNGKPRYNEVVFNDEEVKDIINLYQGGLSSVKIGKVYNQSHKSILKVLHKNNIEVCGKRFVRKYSLDEKYFDNINSPNKAYILGFLYADGSNNPSKSTISMSLQEEDSYILEQIRKEVKSEKPLEYLDYSNKNDFEHHYKNQYRLLFFSSYMCKSLSQIGMVRNKSLVLEFPNISKNLYSHFIRGYFDGDGTINKKTSTFCIVSTRQFVEKVNEILINELGLKYGIIKESPCLNGITYDLYYHRHKETKKIYDWMYQDAELLLKRKYNIYRQIFYKVA